MTSSRRRRRRRSKSLEDTGEVPMKESLQEIAAATTKETLQQQTNHGTGKPYPTRTKFQK